MSYKRFTEVEINFLERTIPGRTHKETAELFNATFKNEITWEQVKGFSSRNGIVVGEKMSTSKKAKPKRCKFWQTNNACYVLDVAQCDGYNTACTFRKSPSEYEAELDFAILTNRLKGNCERCKYRLYKKCKLKGEK